MDKLRKAVLVPVVVLAAGACFATKNDMLIIQRDLEGLRREMNQAVARSDEQTLARIDSLLHAMATLGDSVRGFTGRFYSTAGDLTDSIATLTTAVSQLRHLVETTQSTLDDLATNIELLEGRLAAVQSAAPDSNAVAVQEGPRQLLATSQQLIASGAYGTARMGLEDLLSRFPDSDVAARAQLDIGQTFKREENLAAADSVFMLVAQKYSQSPEAPEALYLLGVSHMAARRYTEARSVLERVLNDYPNYSLREMVQAELSRIPPDTSGVAVDTAMFHPNPR